MPDHNTPHHPTTTTTTRPPRPPPTTTPTTATTASAFLRRLHEHYSPNSTHLMSVLTLLISGSTLLALTGLTLMAVVSCLVFLVPLLVLSLPLWLPIVTLVFVSIAAFLSLCGLGVTTVAAVSWLYRYFRGLQPPGSNRFNYARSRLASTAREVKDYAKEYSGYLHSKVKDAAPGA